VARTIGIFGTVQVLLIVMGFFGLGIVMKWNGYPDQSLGIVWTPLALFLRLHGLLLLAVPALWTTGAAVAENRGQFIITPNLWMTLGLLLNLTLLGLFLYASIYCYTRPLLFWIGH